ncbi:MAG: GGDEF domain-containing protein [Alphaproteobacteria bacterium]|nr:GGDEF domain-containing protein [Alphaproteobacteria bacterium]
MDFDIPSLMMVTTLLLGTCAVILTAHWIANISFIGLGRIAAGASMGAVGMMLQPVDVRTASALFAFSGDVLLLFGQLFIWFGVADFWGVRGRNISFLAYGLLLMGIASLGYNHLEGGSIEARALTYSLFVAGMALGATLSMVQALGGRVGLYKGVIKRKTIGATLLTATFLVHAIFYLYRSMTCQDGNILDAGKLPLAGFTEMEGIIFAIGLTVTTIVMTAERVQADLRIQAMMDPLTQALNRRAFMTVVRTVLARSRRSSEPVSMIMLDIDKFKRINLRHGHMVGDMILTQFAEGVMEGRRAQDVFCRFGGEEFLLLLPGTDEEGAALVANRVRDAVTGYPFKVGKKDISLTVSFGVMTARGDDLTPDSMMDAAYKALRAAQQEGKNRIELASNLTAG